MADLVYVALLAGCIAVSIALIYALERLRKPS